MMKLAIISGTSINRSEVFANWELRTVETGFGQVSVKVGEGLIVVNRHGFEHAMPPHMLNYRGYVSALRSLGVDTAITVSSVGSLKEECPPGTLLSCSDYVGFSPITFVDDRMSGFIPALQNNLIEEIASLVPFEIETGKIYCQTRGPRFETKAEVRILRSLGCDVVGMTFANEADLLLESGIAVNSICMVDNYAHGVGSKALSTDDFHEGVAENQRKIDSLLEAIVNKFGD